MSDEEPQRLLEMGADGLGDALHTDLQRAAAHDVGYDVQAGAARLSEAMAGGGAPGPGGGVATGSTAKIVAIVGLATVIAGGAIAWAMTSSEPPTVASASSEPVVSPDAPSVPAVHEQSQADDTPPAETPEASLQVPTSQPQDDESAIAVEEPPEVQPGTRPRSRKNPRKGVARPSDDDRLRREVQATDRARRALASDPAEALRLVKKANREFADGLFVEDREGIAILALFGSGKTDAAQRRAAAFLRAHPRNSYADRIRKAMSNPEKD